MPPRSRQILDVAAIAFDEHGFHGVGMDELGRRAGLSGPALYRHFAGKDEILAGLLDEALGELSAAARPLTDEPLDDLERALRHHVEYTIAHRPLVSVYQREGSSVAASYRARFNRRRRRYLEQWNVLVGRAFPALAPDDVVARTHMLLGIVFSPTSWPAAVARRPDSVDEFLHLMIRGLSGPVGSR